MQRFTALGAMMLALAVTGCGGGIGPAGELEKGWELMVAKNYPSARDHYEQMLEEYPDNPYALLNLGVAYQQLGETSRARASFEAAIAHGTSAEITLLTDEGGVREQTMTVAEQAQANLETLGS